MTQPKIIAEKREDCSPRYTYLFECIGTKNGITTRFAKEMTLDSVYNHNSWLIKGLVETAIKETDDREFDTVYIAEANAIL